MLELAKGLGEHCLFVVQDYGSLILTMFVAGLTGSLTHCAGMCGPLVAAQSLELAATRGRGQGETWRRLTGGALLPYQFGRTSTYMALGALAALPVGAGSQLLPMNWLSPVLLWTAAAMFLWQGLRKLNIMPRNMALGLPSASLIANVFPTDSRGVLHILRDTTRSLMRSPTGFRGYLLGIMLGFLPCGLLYGALIGAAASGNALAAACAMLAFALGTFPLSWAIGYGSRFAAARFRGKVRMPLAILMIFNAVVLAALSMPLL